MTQPTRLFDYIKSQNQNSPNPKAFGHFFRGEWRYYGTEEIVDKANKLSRGLIQLGVQAGDKIATIVYKNRPEWVILDIAIQQVGAINVPVYPTISPREYVYIFNDASVRFCFVGEGDLYDKVLQAQKDLPALEAIYTIDRFEGRLYWEDLYHDKGQEEVEARMAAVKPEELATIIYTSGTTGNPKGVMLSHNNISSNVTAVADILPVKSSSDRVLSFLPVCHIFERSAIYAYTNAGVSVTFCGTDNLGGEDGMLQRVKPHFFTTVPRLLEKVYEKIYNKGLALTGLKKKLFFWAIDLTKDYQHDKTYGGWRGIQQSIADKLIFSKWREALGGEIKGIVTGAAPCPEHLARMFSAAGVPIREGYGLTETSPGLAIGLFKPGGAMLGAVGMPLFNVELMIDDSDGVYLPGEGEILAHGPNIMMGYYNKEEKTAEVIKHIDGKRWFCTGDIGKFVDGPNNKQFLKITDRKKELLKTSGGKYVAPAPIESKLKEDFLVEQVMVIGEKRKFVSAIILPSEEALKDWCTAEGIVWTSMAELTKNQAILNKFQDIINKVNVNFSHIEKIKKFVLLDASWEPTKTDGSDAELTPTLKLKRRVIRNKYASEIESIYQ
ncbi:MAG: long-chain fatty acid--CoA ligase [Bacteroidota bacterium]